MISGFASREWSTTGPDAPRLRPTVAADAVALLPLIAGQQRVTRWLCWDGPRDAADLLRRYDPAHQDFDGRERIMYAVESNGVATGELSLEWDTAARGEPVRSAEVGYWLGERFHGRGIGRAALALGCDAAFEGLGVGLVIARVLEGNDVSLRILDRCGFSAERAPRRQDACGAGCSPDPADRPIAWICTLTRRRWLRARAAAETREVDHP